MKDFVFGAIIGVACTFLLATAIKLRTDTVDQTPSRIRYPGEEAAAVKACKGQGQKVMYWWLEDPRKNSVTLHARCTGVVNVDAEVKL